MSGAGRAPKLLERGSVKICGLREVEHAIAAAAAGADLLGFIFAPTRRYVAPAAARSMIAAARRECDRPILAVGVFVNAAPAEMNAIADEADLDLIQLSGDEPSSTAGLLERPVLRALSPRPGATAAEAIRVGDSEPRDRILAFLVDGHDPGHFGGTGVRADWELAGDLALTVPMVLAGGLDPDNVAAAISAVAPLGVDVSSGVERDGVKDSELVAAFVRNAKAAFG